MMNQKRSAKYNLLRYLVLGGVVATALLSLNFSRAAFHGKQLTVVADTVPAPPAPVTAPAPVAPTNPDQVVPATPPVPAGPGNVPAPPPPPPRVPAPSGKHATPPPPPPSPQKVVTLDVPSSDPATAPLYVLDGVKQGRTMPMQVDKNDIDAINVLKYDHALNRYGEEGRNGVIEIYTKGYKGAKTGCGSIQDLSRERGAAQGGYCHTGCLHPERGRQLTSALVPHRWCCRIAHCCKYPAKG